MSIKKNITYAFYMHKLLHEMALSLEHQALFTENFNETQFEL